MLLFDQKWEIVPTHFCQKKKTRLQPLGAFVVLAGGPSLPARFWPINDSLKIQTTDLHRVF